ncbi:DUF2254 domain-containing protein [Acidisoma cellulosilytica]|uniref:DUF2254 domain-containing protein n=1 Tax=Acidisoma cellulosilyticum TaxID=2802395 RepID=A0A963Z684_9PROT|nr:DUF2254 domain-containing protein [Acidisoma cellulosilyticum]MCB8883329.1 DUF2254 domain-containing protein [Acidisoma cellulosilyticum]
MPRWLWILTIMLRRLWLRATLLGVLGVLAAILGAVAQRFVPFNLPNIGASSVGTILNIMASSMLSVTTFSLSVVTSAYGSATSNVSPRATKLVMEDSVTQNALSAFMGSFLFSIVGIIVLQTGAYGDRGRAILFIVTIGVIILVVVSLLRWIDHLTGLGRVGETTSRVEKAARAALQARLDNPYLGGQRLAAPERAVPEGAIAICTDDLGYLLHIDMLALSHAAEALDAEIYVRANPGAFIYADTVLAWVNAHQPGDAVAGHIHSITQAFSIGHERSFDQDPRFGLVVLSEVASRALSPAVNDPGTAIDVIGRLVRLMTLWSKNPDETADEAIKHPRVHVPPLATADLFEDAFMAIGRDGAGMIEVQLRLQKGLNALGRIGDADFQAAARHQAEQAASRAQAVLTLDAEKLRLRRVGEEAAVTAAARMAG